MACVVTGQLTRNIFHQQLYNMINTDSLNKLGANFSDLTPVVQTSKTTDNSHSFKTTPGLKGVVHDCFNLLNNLSTCLFLSLLVSTCKIGQKENCTAVSKNSALFSRVLTVQHLFVSSKFSIYHFILSKVFIKSIAY